MCENSVDLVDNICNEQLIVKDNENFTSELLRNYEDSDSFKIINRNGKKVEDQKKSVISVHLSGHNFIQSESYSEAFKKEIRFKCYQWKYANPKL